jgi:hypothetical protein
MGRPLAKKQVGFRAAPAVMNATPGSLVQCTRDQIAA